MTIKGGLQSIIYGMHIGKMLYSQSQLHRLKLHSIRKRSVLATVYSYLIGAQNEEIVDSLRK